MQEVARGSWVAFERRLERALVPAPQRPDYHKWIRFYLDATFLSSSPTPRGTPEGEEPGGDAEDGLGCPEMRQSFSLAGGMTGGRQATLEPPQCDTKATPRLVDSQPIGTLKPH